MDAYLDQWFEGVRPALRPSTAKSYGEIVRWYLRPHLGAVRLSDLNVIQVRALYADLSRGGFGADGWSARAGDDRSRAPRAAKGVQRRGRCGLLTRSPLVGVRPPRREPPEIQTWSAAEAQTFLAAVRSDRLFALWALVLATGLRRGEVAGLKWDDIDFEARCSRCDAAV